MTAGNEITSWKPKHPGIPNDWRQIGEGGNAYVWTDGTHAIKRLKQNASSEAVRRFEREAKILAELDANSGHHIVPIVEVRNRANETEIVMSRMDGNLDNIVKNFTGDPAKAALALAPVAEALASLAGRDPAIHHRDIKPTNILFKDSEEKLYIGDFGCAYIADDERITPQRRAIGAWAYRPPEYSVGRAIEIDEKGDVFGLGKVFWSMINGESGVVFPGPVWFRPEYDLGVMFPDNPKSQHAMLVISKAVSVEPRERPTLHEFAMMLRDLAGTETPTGDRHDIQQILRAEADIEIAFQQRRAATSTFVRAVNSDFHGAIEALHTDNPSVQIWTQWNNDLKHFEQFVGDIASQVADQESDAPALVSRFRQRILHGRFFPPKAEGSCYFILALESEADSQNRSSLTIWNRPTGVSYDLHYTLGQSESGKYSASLIRSFLQTATSQSMRGRF